MHHLYTYRNIFRGSTNKKNLNHLLVIKQLANLPGLFRSDNEVLGIRKLPQLSSLAEREGVNSKSWNQLYMYTINSKYPKHKQYEWDYQEFQ